MEAETWKKKVIGSENVIISEWTAEINLHRAESAYVNRVR